MSPTSEVRRAPERARQGELARKLLASSFFAFPLLFAKVSPVGAAGMQEGQIPAGENPTGEDPGQPAAEPEAQTIAAPVGGEISLPDALGGAKVDADTLTTLQNTINQIAEGRTPQNMVSIYNGARDTINALGPQGPLSQLGMENVGAEITFSLDAKGQIATGIGPDSNPDSGAVTNGVKARVVSEVGTNLADGKNQIAVGVLGITSRSLTTGEVGVPDQVTQGRRTTRVPVDLAGPGAAAEEHAGVVYSYVTPTDQPIPSAFPDINNPETMTIGSTLRMMPVDANWATWSTSMPGYYEDTVDINFGQMFQVTRVSENTYEIATGPVDMDAAEPGLQVSLAGTRLAVAAGDVKGTADLQAKNYDLSKPDDATAFRGVLAEGIPQEGWNPNQVDVEFGQFAINGYLTPAAPSAKTPNKTPGVEDPGPFSLNIAADLTLKGQIPYSGYVVAEVQPPASADEPPTVVFSRYAPGVEITGKGVLFTDAQGNQYVRDTKVQMRIPDLAFMPHKGIIDVNQDQLAILDQVLDPNVEPPDLTLHQIFPGVLPDFLSPASNFALTRGVEALYDLGVTSDRFMVPGNVDYRTQPPAIEGLAPPGVTVDFDTRVETGEVPGQFPGAVGPRSEAPGADPLASETPAIVDVAPESMAAAGIGHDADFSEAFGPDTAVVPGPLEQAIEQAAAEAAASVDFQPVPTVEPGFGFDGLGLRSNAEGSEPTGLDTTDESEAAPGAREAEISAAAAELGSVVDFDRSDASFDLGLDGDGIGSFWSASDAAAGIGADADFSGAFGDSPASSAPADGSGSSPTQGLSPGGTETDGDVSPEAAGVGASVDSSVDGSSFASGLDGFSSIGESSAASQAAAGIGADADFSGAFGDSPASEGSVPSDGAISPEAAGVGASVDSSVDGSSFASGLDGFSSIGESSAASQAAAGIGADADFSGAFGDSPASVAPADGSGSSPTRGLSPGGTETDGTDGSGGFGTDGTGGVGSGPDSGDSGFGADTSSSFSSTTSYGGDSSGFGGDSSGLGGDSSSGIGGFSAASEAAASIGSDADFGGAFSSSPSTDASGYGADTSSSFSSTTSYGGDSSGFGGDSSGFGGDSSSFGGDSSSSFSSTTSYGGDSSGFSSSSFSSSPSSSGDSSSSTSSSSSSSGGFSTSGDGGF